MYIESIAIENLKSISKLRWDLGALRPEGWHVILGDNGSGKTTFLRGVCFALLGPRDADPLVGDWANYMRDVDQVPSCELVIRRDREFDIYPEGGFSKLPLGLRIVRDRAGFAVPTYPTVDGEHPRIDRRDGWFSAAYGPFRRFTGGDPDEQERLFARPIVGRHMSVFAARVALTQPIEWLIGLHTEQLDTGKPSELLQQIIAFINQDDILPNGVRFDRVTSRDVLFTDARGAMVKITDLSDGYGSVLCMTLELLRQLSLAYPKTAIFELGEAITVAVPGVVLVDEVDVHLHPSWQRTIGLWYRKHFPKMQFIVTTHSPLICQAAEHGSVYALPDPSTGEGGGFVDGPMLDRLLYGNMLDAFSTNLFGDDVGLSEVANRRLQRLAALNLKDMREGLSEAEAKDQEQLQRVFGSMPSILPPMVEGGKR